MRVANAGITGSKAGVQVVFEIPSLEGAEGPSKLSGEKGPSALLLVASENPSKLSGEKGPSALLLVASGNLQLPLHTVLLSSSRCSRLQARWCAPSSHKINWESCSMEEYIAQYW